MQENNNLLNNNKYPGFSNFRNLFTFRRLSILTITLALSFSIRMALIFYFKYDPTLFQDFFLLGFSVSFVRSLVTDLFDIIMYSIGVPMYDTTYKSYFCLHRKNLSDDLANNNVSNTHTNNIHNISNHQFKNRIKRGLFWLS